MKKLIMKKLHLIIIATLLISCSNPLDKAYNQETLEEDIIKLKDTLSEEELNTLGGYIFLKSISNDNMLGISYGDLLDEAKKINEENRLKTEEDAKKLLIEKGNIVCDYEYNIGLRRKKLFPVNIRFLSDTSIIMRTKTDYWEYSINSIEESTNEKFSVVAFGGNISSEKQEYKLIFREGLVSVERLSNNAKWWFVSVSAMSSFESELEAAGLIFHK